MQFMFQNHKFVDPPQEVTEIFAILCEREKAVEKYLDYPPNATSKKVIKLQKDNAALVKKLLRLGYEFVIERTKSSKKIASFDLKIAEPVKKKVSPKKKKS